MWRVADPLAERSQNARLADASLARQQGDLTLAVARVAPAGRGAAPPPRAHAPYEGWQKRCDRDASKAADVLRLAKDRPAGNRRVEAFQGLSVQAAATRTRRPGAAAWTPAISTVPGSASACNRAARLGVSPTTGLFLRRALSNKVADHDDPRGDADADLEIFIRPRFELGDGGGYVQTSSDRTFGILLVRRRGKPK